MSNSSDGNKRGGRGNRDRQGRSDAKPKEQRAAPIRVTMDQLMTKMQVCFKKYVKGDEAAGGEEEKDEQAQPVF